MSEFLTADEILRADDLKVIDVVVPEWGNKKVRLKTMTAGEAIEFTKTLEGEGQLSANVRAVIATALDERGQKLFNESHTAALTAKSTKAVNRLAIAIRDLNGLDAERLKAEAKNDSSGAVREDLRIVSPQN